MAEIKVLRFDGSGKPLLTFEVLMRVGVESTENFIIQASTLEGALAQLVTEYGWQPILGVAVEPFGFSGPGMMVE